MKQANQKIWCVNSVLTLILTLFVSLTHAQPVLPTISGGKLYVSPMTKQLYPRNPVSNFGSVAISGKMRFSGRIYTSIRRKVYRDDNGNGTYGGGELIGTATETVVLNGAVVNDSVSFAFTNYNLPAELFNYRFEIVGVQDNAAETILAGINEVVAGDAYIISGQSNAEAANRCGLGVYNCLDNVDNEPFDNNIEGTPGPIRKFVRVYGNGQGTGLHRDNPGVETYNAMPKTWGIASGNATRYTQLNNKRYVGQWGMHLGMQIVENHDVPVCILNAGVGANIGHFQKSNAANYTGFGADPSGKNNYTTLLARAIDAGVKDNIRGIFWFQGESNMTADNGQNLTTAGYKAQFDELYDDWESDYTGFSKLYVVQVKRGCFENNPDDALKIMQAHQEIVNERPGVAHLISSSNAAQIFEAGINYCHYSWLGGYEEIGNRAYAFVSRHFYGGNVNDLNWQPLIVDKAAYGPDPNKIQIRIIQAGDNIALQGSGIAADFRLEGGSYTISNVTVTTSNRIEITYSNNPGTLTRPTSVSYFGHSGAVLPAITNSSGAGLAYFGGLPILDQSLPVDPLSLTVARNANSNSIRWKVESNERFEQFVVERGETRNSFRTIGEIFGTGQEGIIQYDFTDNKPNTTVSHYRIKAIQQDGKLLYSQVVTLNNRLNTVKEFRVYPNPVAGSANATIHLNEGAMATINLHDASGRLLSSRKLQLQKGNNQFSLGELLDYNPGTYIVRVVTASETQQVRVVKAK